MVGRAAGGAVKGWQWEQLDVALGNSWMGEPGDGGGRGWVTLMGTRGCHQAKRGFNSFPATPRAATEGFSLSG